MCSLNTGRWNNDCREKKSRANQRTCFGILSRWQYRLNTSTHFSFTYFLALQANNCHTKTKKPRFWGSTILARDEMPKANQALHAAAHLHSMSFTLQKKLQDQQFFTQPTGQISQILLYFTIKFLGKSWLCVSRSLPLTTTSDVICKSTITSTCL